MLQKRKNGLRWLRLLMILAQLMLIALVVQWITMQYGEAGRDLNLALEKVCQETEKQMLDTLLMKNIVNPVIDCKRNNNTPVFLQDSMPQSDQNNDFLKKDTVIINHISESKEHSDEKQISSTVVINASQPGKSVMMLSGVKLFITQMQDSLNSYSFYSNIFLSDFDTTTYLKTLNPLVESISPKLKIKLEPVSNKFISGSNTTFHYLLGNEGKKYLVSVDGYNQVVFERLIKPVAFALLILFLSAAAFFIALRSLRQQIELNIMRDDFIRNMSHELKTPVSTVKVALEALEKFSRKNNPEKLTEYLGLAGKELDRLELLIERVLSVSGLSEANHRFFAKKTNIIDLCEEVVFQFSPIIEQTGASVSFSREEYQLYVNGDELQLQGVIFNLLDNALKYSGSNAQIAIVVKKNGKMIEIRVSDNGPGIPPEFADRIFEKFFRVPSGDQHNIKGSGLGLTYSRVVAKLHHGNLRYHRGENGGALFILSLPTI